MDCLAGIGIFTAGLGKLAGVRVCGWRSQRVSLGEVGDCAEDLLVQDRAVGLED